MLTDIAINSLGLVLVAFFNAVGLIVVGYFQYRQISVVREVRDIAKETHINTNSMKDELNRVTRVAALAEGKEDERLAGERLREAEAKGRAEIEGRKNSRNNKELDAAVSDAVQGKSETN